MSYSNENPTQIQDNFHNNGNFSTERVKNIQAIIEQRQEQAKQVKAVKENWLSLQERLQQIEEKRQQISNNPNLSERLASYDFYTTLESIDSAKEELDNLEKRLSRKTLNIGVVGRMRNGKSRLLQSLTGLDEKQIPTSSKGVCTRGLSKIFHVSEQSEVRNEIEFHSWSSFKEIIHLYFDKLGLEEKPEVPDDMAGNKRPPNLPEDKRQDINARFLYGRLCREYYGRFDEYRSLLDGSTKLVRDDQINKYITQDDNNSGEYLTVKELRIFCQFPYHEEVGKIGVIDLPGLGDDNIFDLERLIKTLKQDIDVILFVRMPKYTGDDWEEADRQMFQIARDALGEFPLSDCSFVVLNRIQQGQVDNYELCQIFSQKIYQQEIKINHNPIIANCSAPAEVNQIILTPVLNYLARNISSVYKQYLRSCNQRLQEIQSEISNQLEQAKQAIVGYSEEEGSDFEDWFNDVWLNLTRGLYALRYDLQRKQNDEDEKFKAAIEEAVEKCRSEAIIPTVDEIDMQTSVNRDSYKITYLVYVDQIRSKLSNNFNALGRALGELLKKVQMSVITVLAEQGKLESLTSQKGNNFFEEIAQQLPPKAHQLKKGFEDIKHDDKPYDKIVKEWIKDHLEKLQPDVNIDPISQSQITQAKNPNIEKLLNFIEQLKVPNNSGLETQVSHILGHPISKDNIAKIWALPLNQVSEFIQNQYQPNNQQLNLNNSSPADFSEAEQIKEKLEILREEVVNNCNETLHKRLSEPNKLAFTMVTDFLNQVLASPGVETEWRKFFGRHKEQVWDGAKQKKDSQNMEKEWQKLVSSAQEANETDKLQLPLS